MNPGLKTRSLLLDLAFLAILLGAVIVAPVAADDVGGITMPGTKDFYLMLSDGSTKYFKFDSKEGSGLNALHITTDPNSPYGQVTTTDEQSGVFYLSETGGRGFFDDMILMVAVNGAIPDDFALHVRASGYRWTPTAEKNMPPTAEMIEYIDGAYEGTITKNDFKYSPQTWKPAGNNMPGAYPIYYGQDVSDSSKPFQTVFIDLNVGTLGENSKLTALTNNGAVKIEYALENFGTFAAFNSYGWCNQSNQGQGISWTNQVSGIGSSGYAVIGTAPQGGDVAPGSGGDSGTGTSSGLSGSEFAMQESGEIKGHAALVTTKSAPFLLDGGGSTKLSLTPPVGNGTVRKATLYLFVEGSKQNERGIDPALTVTVNGQAVSPDRTTTDREGAADAPVAATYAFDMDRLPEGTLSIEVRNTGTQGALCTLDGGALFVVREDQTLPEIIWQIAEGCDAVAIDGDGGVSEEDAVTKMVFNERLQLDRIGAARLYVVGTGPRAWTDGGGRVGLNDKEWPAAFGRNGFVLLADLDAARALLPRENVITVRAQKNAGDGGILVNRLAVLVTTRGTPVSADAGVAAGTVPTMTKAFLIDNPVVSRVAVTLPEQHSPFIVTVEDAEKAGGGAPPEGEVYRYLKLRLEGAKSEPASLALTFHVPTAWIADHGLKAADVALMRRVGGEWQALPTVVGEEKDGAVEFTAQSERLSLFVIGAKAGNGATVSETTSVPAKPTPQQSPAGLAVPVIAGLIALFIRKQ
jgi:PGF-pre-PGF domain-containing protein